MNSTRTLVLSALAFVAAAGLARADVVETKNGSHLVGKVTKIDAGTVSIDTVYAGTISIKQSEVAGITTDGPVAVRLASGTRIDGKISSSDGTLQVVGADGTVTTSVAKVAASWPAGGKDPQLIALERGWAYEATVDASGKRGNKSQLGTSAGVRATLAGVNDKLVFYAAYDRQVADGAKSADQMKIGSDYQSNFAGKNSWYVRDEGGFDRVKNLQLYDVAAFGLGYDLVKRPKQTLTSRVGLSYTYENYYPVFDVPSKRYLANGADVSAAGLDVGINHTVTFTDSSLVTRISYVPTFNDFANYRFTQESFYELPLANPQWKMRFGLSNDYTSKPGQGVKTLDTSYFTRLVLNWK